MKKHLTSIIGILLIVSIFAGCQSGSSEEEIALDENMGEYKAEGQMSIQIINKNRYSTMAGINAPTGKIMFMPKEDTWYLSFMDDFTLSDEGDITIYASKKENILSADDLKEDSYEISELISKEGAQEYRINEEVPMDEIKSIGFFDKENNMLVAWATFK